MNWNYCINCDKVQAFRDDFCHECGSTELVAAEYLHEFQQDWAKSVEAAEAIGGNQVTPELAEWIANRIKVVTL